ncbi:MAG: hypothetical protein HOP29_04425 [Phycisphaerales bacterium]|nr:hypothetical protein [Phycisphaerales bacterium]
MTRAGINMMHMRLVCWVAVVSACGLSAGCQNRLSVRVEKVLGVSSTRLDPDSRLGRQLDAAIVDLTNISARRAEFVRARDTFLDKSESAELRDAKAEILTGVSQSYDEIAENAGTLRAQCEGYFGLEDVALSSSELRTTLRRVRQFLYESRARASLAVDALKQTSTFKELGEELTEAVEGMRIAIEAADEPSPGFGGFVSTDIYPINPSDPKYRDILNSSSPWEPLKWLLWKRNLSVELLTKAEVEVSGDSSIMLVMEHPGQYRIYQISNDPTQIARNIALVVSKATAAMARFAAIVP